MLRKLLNRLLAPRHYWRDVGFDQLGELYTSIMFRSLAISLINIFVPIYLYQLGFAIWEIFMFYVVLHAVNSIVGLVAAYLVAKVGPKHTMLASYICQTVTMFLLVSLPEQQWPLSLIAFAYGVTNALFFTAFHVDFSKVKHRDHGGKEVGWLISVEKVGAVLGPIVGGVVGYVFGAQYIFAAAILLLFIGIVPLFLTQEPTATNQKLDFKGLDLQSIKYDIISCTSMLVENVIVIVMWPLFLAIFVFANNPYIQIGAITSLSVFVSLFLARIMGRTIDKNKGRQLLRFGAIGNGILHLFRPFTGGFPMALGINLANEAVTPAYRMPLTKGFYDAADDLPGRRIVYIALIESFGSFNKALFFLLFGVLAFYMSNQRELFVAIFFFAAVLSLGIMLERFKALDPR